MGILQCPFKLGGHSFEFNFIVCWNLIRPIILGLDFMCKHPIRLSWSDTGKGLLTLKYEVLVEIITNCETGPQLTPYSNLILPPRTLAVVSVHVGFEENPSEHTYRVKPNSFLMDQYPNLVIIPVIYMMPMPTDTTILSVIINLSLE